MMELIRFGESKMQEYATAKEVVRKQRKMLKEAEKNLKVCLEAQEFIQAAASKMQEQMHKGISAIVTKCLEMIFDHPYTFVIHFDKKRGKTEARMVFVDRDSGEEIDPVSESGGGVVDVASFALRLAAMVMMKPKPRQALLLDEPLKFLSKNYRPRVRDLLESLSEDLGIQIIMITHDEDLISGKVVRIEKSKRSNSTRNGATGRDKARGE